ncbi:hypothetical protein AWV80_27255 [Cupriavidus sp. UYMU48A]|nr:hypothetical protein AWV80_27255 [Cupriavidus sp. UYMU48A]
MLFVCWLAILLEGYDVGVMGAVLPALAEYRAWNLSPLQLGALGAYALAGMFFGAFCIGTLSDLFGLATTQPSLSRAQYSHSIVRYLGSALGTMTNLASDHE